MPATRLIALNGSGGAFVAVLSTIPARRVMVREDEAAASVGLQFQKPDDNFTNLYTVGVVGTPDQQQIVLPDPVVTSLRGAGRLLGLPAQGSAGAFNYRAADTYIKLRSKAAGATTVRVVEEE